MPQSAGKSAIDGRDANAVELFNNGVRMKLFFDASAGLILKRERDTADGLEEVFYSDYRAIEFGETDAAHCQSTYNQL